jgi:hypothetical protein
MKLSPEDKKLVRELVAERNRMRAELKKLTNKVIAEKFEVPEWVIEKAILSDEQRKKHNARNVASRKKRMQDPEKVQKAREWWKKYREENKSKLAVFKKLWWHKNKERIKAERAAKKDAEKTIPNRRGMPKGHALHDTLPTS